MKYKWIILLSLLTIFFAINVRATDVDSIELNSKNLISYLKKNNQLEKVKYICNTKYCSKEMIGNREIEINNFIDSYVSQIKKKSLEEGIKIELKGFKITKVAFNDF